MASSTQTRNTGQEEQKTQQIVEIRANSSSARWVEMIAHKTLHPSAPRINWHGLRIRSTAEEKKKHAVLRNFKEETQK